MAAGALSIGVSLLCILPAFTALYRWHFSRSDIKSTLIIAPGTPTERTPLLPDEEQLSTDAQAGPAPQAPSSEEPLALLSASQDLVIAWISLFIYAISAIWVSTVQSIIGIAIGM